MIIWVHWLKWLQISTSTFILNSWTITFCHLSERQMKNFIISLLERQLPVHQAKSEAEWHDEHSRSLSHLDWPKKFQVKICRSNLSSEPNILDSIHTICRINEYCNNDTLIHNIACRVSASSKCYRYTSSRESYNLLTTIHYGYKWLIFMSGEVTFWFLIFL